jgi:hypothetical protein
MLEGPMQIDRVAQYVPGVASRNESIKESDGAFSRLFEAALSTRTTVSDVDRGKLELAFNSWRTGLSPSVQSADMIERVEANADGYLAVLRRADEKGGFDQPQAFLNGLSRSDLASLQAIHGLADPIETMSLSKEAALNLLMPPNSLKDVNKDGFLSVGAALTWTFPPVDAPDNVKQAWTAATAGMDAGQIMNAQISFMPIIPPGGTAADAHAYLGAGANYTKLVETALDSAIYAKRFDQPWQHEFRDQQIAFLKRFQDSLA